MGEQLNRISTSDVTVSLRDTPPAHYMLKVESFSILSQLASGIKERRYESEDFEAGGYKWRLVLYPDGDKARGVNGHISLYLMIAETDALPPGWVVNVNFKLFIYDHIRDKFYTFQAANVGRFHAIRTRLGFPRLVSLEVFNKGSNGCLSGDTCVFGAEVFVINKTVKCECLSTLKTGDNKLTWKIENFSLLKEKKITSKMFIAGGLNWMLDLYPKGHIRARGESLSVFVRLNDSETLSHERKVIAQWTIIVKNQKYGEHVSVTGKEWFTASCMSWGRDNVFSLKNLRDPSKGYLVNGTLIIEATVDYIARVEEL